MEGMKRYPIEIIVVFYPERSGSDTPWIVMLRIGESARIERMGFATSDEARDFAVQYNGDPDVVFVDSLFQLVEGVGILPYEETRGYQVEKLQQLRSKSQRLWVATLSAIAPDYPFPLSMLETFIGDLNIAHSNDDEIEKDIAEAKQVFNEISEQYTQYNSNVNIANGYITITSDGQNILKNMVSQSQELMNEQIRIIKLGISEINAVCTSTIVAIENNMREKDDSTATDDELRALLPHLMKFWQRISMIEPWISYDILHAFWQFHNLKIISNDELEIETKFFVPLCKESAVINDDGSVFVTAIGCIEFMVDSGLQLGKTYAPVMLKFAAELLSSIPNKVDFINTYKKNGTLGSE